MATMDPVPYTNQIVTSQMTNNTYVQPVYYQGHQCSNCGQWVYGHHNCYYQPPVQTIVITQGFPPPTSDPGTKQELKEVKDELKEVRNLLEKLMELAVNEHEEVRRPDEAGSEDQGVDTGGSREGSLRIDVTAEVRRHLGL